MLESSNATATAIDLDFCTMEGEWRNCVTVEFELGVWLKWSHYS